LRAPQLSIDELNYLGQAFNRMLSRFSQRLEKQKAAEQEIMRLNQDLEEKVAKRTHALQLTNKELIDTLEQLHLYQGQVLEREKLLRLGDMVAEISHELNSPLGLGITTATTIQQSLHELKQSMQQSELSQRQLTEFLEQLDEACRILTRNLQRAGELIESFKHVAVDQCSEQDRTFNLKSFLNEVLLTLKPHLKKTRHQVHLFCPDNIVINSKPGALSQIIINLIQNSLQHGFQHIEQGNITISAAINSLQQLELVYQDDGCGMSDEIKKQVFAIYFTTAKDRGGSGMGMYLVQNIVYQLLGGELYLETSFNHGITLTIKIPTKMKDSFT
jgi:signal transduction histidine kinase